VREVVSILRVAANRRRRWSRLLRDRRLLRAARNRGEPKVGAGAEADEPDAFTAGYTVAGFFPADYATGDESRDLLEDDLAGVGGESDHVLLVVSGSGFAHAAANLPGR